MEKTLEASLLQSIKEVNGKWFSPANSRFFGDKAYRAAYGRKSGNAYLFQYTHRWSDMFGGSQTFRWVGHHLEEGLKIGRLIEWGGEVLEFADFHEVKRWLRNN